MSATLPTPLRVDDLTVVARDLHRPEGVCIGPDGQPWASDQTGLVARLVDGVGERFGHGGVAPNGLAVDGSGRILVADYGGGLARYDPAEDRTELLVDAVEGRPARWANYPVVGVDNLVWCSVSTVGDDDLAAFQSGIDDGYVFVLGPDGATVVSDGHHFANGLARSPDGSHLYIAESSARRVVRAPVLERGRLGTVEPYGPELPATPDGLAFDLRGNLWVSLVFQRNAVVVIDPEGGLHTVIDDPEARVLHDPTNLCFGGPDGRDLYVTSTAAGLVVRARVDVPGIVLAGPDAS